MPLTDTMLRNLKSDGTPAKLADSEGLYLYLSASGGKLWRMDYRYAGKRKTFSFGAYPAVSLKDARRKRDKANERRRLAQIGQREAAASGMRDAPINTLLPSGA